jgi:hypothetical protein
MIIMRPELGLPADCVDDIGKKLQTAVLLELSTIPVYLYSWYSMPVGTNTATRQIVFSVALQEMLHLGLVCNVMNAIGVPPILNNPHLTPTYPHRLPGSITGVTATLEPISVKHVKHVFMAIEEPEHPIPIPEANAAAMDSESKRPVTIGRFYTQILRDLKALDPDTWCTHTRLQLPTSAIPGMDMIQVTSFSTAQQAILTIIEQGEGTSDSPLQNPADAAVIPAHFYRFEQIVKNRVLHKNPTPPPNPKPRDLWQFGPSRLGFDPSVVTPLAKNPRSIDYTGSAATANAAFNKEYTAILKGIHCAVNGSPASISDLAYVQMPLLSSLAAAVTDIKIGDGVFAGPTFEFVE